MKTKAISYWVTTILLCVVLVGGGAANLARAWGTLDVMRRLGYPPYILTILGVWKMLGAIALLAPGFPRLKEWAYAGVFFEMTGAAASHLVSGTPAWNVWVTVGFALLTLVSWALRPPGRIAGVLFSPRPAAERI
jgi:DoxX-like family